MCVQEYEEQETEEARAVKDIDRFEMILQAYEYEKKHGKSLQEFFDSTRGQFRNSQVQQWVETLYKARATLHLPQQ
ncbi:hypothetical protein LAZ67_18002364 [Cordylochernes scorpioides]|uniref:HD domain-containing protein n=1 Tax=Cordylochernes scorpioides TaxID=51811 RepID=A0ABY6LGK6_9ARAC|nr:hypothetical protein LAZ67_18002364 [Cordylochernes scorpioides]